MAKIDICIYIYKVISEGKKMTIVYTIFYLFILLKIVREIPQKYFIEEKSFN